MSRDVARERSQASAEDESVTASELSSRFRPIKRLLRPEYWKQRLRPRDRAMLISDTDVLAEIYQALLGRDPDDVGLRDYLRRFRSKELSLTEIVHFIATSEEATKRLGAERAPQWLFRSSAFQTILEQAWQTKVDRRRPLFFLHIMKTGGTSLRDALQQFVEPERCLTDLFLDQFVALPEYVLSAMTLVAGHLPYEAVELLPPGFAVCTVIRDPVDRTISHYWHLRSNRAALGRDLSIEEFVTSPRWRAASANYQARQLVHRIGISRAWVDYSPRGRLGRSESTDPSLPVQSLFDTAPLSISDDALEREALERLNHIELVGVTEHLDRLIAEVSAMWDVEHSSALVPARVGAGRPSISDVPQDLIEMIREQNAVDRALYELARERALGAVRTK